MIRINFTFRKKDYLTDMLSFYGDAMILVLDGEACVTIDGKELSATSGLTVVMPANVPHSVFAATRFKMRLTVVKQPVGIRGM